MVEVHWIWIIVLLAAFCYLLPQLQWITKRKRLPPSPTGLPILGHLHLLGKNPHQDLFNLAKKHGSIMYLRFGLVPAIIVSSPESAEKFLRTHDLSFASRPYHEASYLIGYGQKNLSFSPYGPYWRNIRKICTLQLLSNSKITSFQSMRRAEIELFIETIKSAALDRSLVDLTALISSTTFNMSCLMLFGKKYMDKDIDDRGLKDLIQELMHDVAVPNIGDFLPFLSVLDLQGLVRRFRDFAKVFDGFLEKVIDDHAESKGQEETRDFVDILMGIMQSGEAGFGFDRSNVKAIVLDIMIASMDTSATAIEWAISELLRHPNVIKKLQNEIEQKVGRDRMVHETDLEGLTYLDMVVKETMRLHPVAPLLLPHEAIEDCSIDGYDIERKSRIIVNAWAIGRDPIAWTEPESFIPERFLDSNVDLRGRDFELIPFGSGRRMCPGMQLGLTVVRLVLAQLVHCFDWELPNNMLPSELDMSEVFGLVTSRANHLLAVPTSRLLAGEQ